MKFLALIALVAAQDEEAATGLEANADCSEEGAMCADGLCCGTATEATDAEEEQGGDEEAAPAGLMVCNAADATAWTNPDDEELVYTFACNMDGASKLAAASLAVAAYLMA